jgi:hypothetical protein
VLDGLSLLIKQHGEALTKFGDRKAMNWIRSIKQTMLAVPVWNQYVQ